MSKMIHLSDGEFRVMNAIWLSETELTQAMVMKTVNNTLDKKLNVSTYATYLRRIIRKGYLEKVYRGSENTHPIYRPTISREEYFERCAQEFQSRWSSKQILNFAISILSQQTPEERQAFVDMLLPKDN